MNEQDIILKIKPEVEPVDDKEVKKVTKDLEEQFNDAKKTTEDLKKEMDELGESSNVAPLIDKMEDLEKTIQDDIDKAKELQNTLDQSDTPTQYHDLLEILTQLEGQLLKVNNRKNDFLEKGGDATSNTFKGMEIEAQRLENQIKDILQQMVKLEEAGQDFSLGLSTEQAAEYANELAELNNKIRIHIEALKAQQNQIKQQTAIKGKVLSFYNSWAANVKMLGKLMIDSALKVAQLTKQIALLAASRLRSGISKLIEPIKQLKNNADSAGLSMKGLVINLFKYTLGLNSLAFVFNKLRSAITESVKNILEYKDGMTDIGRSINSVKNNLIYLKNAWVAAFAPLASFVIPVVNKAIAWLGKLAEKIAAFFSILLGKNTMLKAVQSSTGYGGDTQKDVNKAADKAKKDATKANDKAKRDAEKAEKEAQKKAEKAKKAADKAAKQQKKRNSQLFDWDELNKQQDQDTDDLIEDIEEATEVLDDLGDAAANLQDMFTEVPVKGILPEWLEEWIDKLKELWNNGQWFELGQHIADLFNKGLVFLDNWINNTFRPWGVKWASRIAQILNGFVDRLDWKLLGKTIADGINAVFDIANTFLTTFDFEKFGSKVGEGIYSWFTNIDWDLIGRTFANKWNALIDFIYGLVSTPGLFVKIGTSIRNLVYSWFDTIKWEKAAFALQKGINGVFETLDAFFGQKSRIPEFVTRITKAINFFFKGINWQRNGKIIAKTLNTIIEAFKNFVKTLEWEDIGRGVGKFFKNIFSNINTQDLLTSLQELKDGLTGAIAGMLDEMDISSADIVQFAENLATTIADGINEVVHSEAFKTAIQAAFTFVATIIGNIDWSAIVTALKDSLTTAIANMDDATKAGIADAIVTVLGAAVALTAGKSIAEGFFVGIGNLLANGIAKAVTGEVAKDIIAGGIQTVLHSSISVGIGKTVLTGATAAGATVAGAIVAGILGYKIGKDWLGKLLFPEDADLYSEFKLLPGLADIAKGIYEGLTGEIDVSFSGFFDFLKNELIDQNQLGGIGSGIVEGLIAGVKAAWIVTNPLGFIELITNLIKQVKEVLKQHSPSQVFFDIGDGIVQGLQNGVTELWKKFSADFIDGFTTLKNEAEKKVKPFVDIGKQIVNGIKQGIKDTWDKLYDFVMKQIDKLPEGVKQFLKISSPSKVFAEIGGFISLGLAEGIDDESNSVQSAMNDMMNDVIKDADSFNLSPEVAMDDMVLNLDSALDRLATIADKFNQIGEVFNTISSVTIPDIAVGKVVPQMISSTSSANSSTAMDSLQAVVDRLVDAISNMQMTREPIYTSVEVNGKTVFDIVVDENNREVQRTGRSPIKI